MRIRNIVIPIIAAAFCGFVGYHYYSLMSSAKHIDATYEKLESGLMNNVSMVPEIVKELDKYNGINSQVIVDLRSQVDATPNLTEKVTALESMAKTVDLAVSAVPEKSQRLDEIITSYSISLNELTKDRKEYNELVDKYMNNRGGIWSIGTNLLRLPMKEKV